ncbi:MAG: diguanylate cyclase [Spirochaetales bacterium]|uniref:diguanylate cyclase n=1 Tax=Candidatus Thalassospirochaeta sargassi TaxID=3119039 RepID=A0AAJ1IHZ0_9SPIO|nr:diguanylate cyclase [Spirochaetales bacterium]
MNNLILPMEIAFILVFSSAMIFFLASWTYGRRKKVAGAYELSFFLFATGLYSSGYALEITSSTLEEVFWALRLQFIGLPFLSFSFLVFSLRFVGGKTLPGIVKRLLLVIPIVTTVLVLTIEKHSWFYRDAYISFSGRFPVLEYEPGPWYGVNFLYLIIISLISEFVLVYGVVKSRSVKRKQCILVLISGILPSSSGILTPERFYGIDLQPFMLTGTCILIAVALFRYGMLELVPHARDTAVDSIDEMLLVTDSAGILLDMNASAAKSELFGEIKVGDPLKLFNEFASRSDKEGEAVRHRFEFGDRTYDIHMHQVDSGSINRGGWAIIIRDITEIFSLMNKLEHQAIYDDLTGLFNRRHIMELANRELDIARRGGRTLTVILMDIDKFKDINDTYGHITGDTVLKELGRVLHKAMRVSDQVGRYGGEEFIIICPETNPDAGIAVAERLRESIEKISFNFEGEKVVVTASFGVFTAAVDSEAILDPFLANADRALYRAKELGRNRVETI